MLVQEVRNSSSNTELISLAGVVPVLMFMFDFPRGTLELFSGTLNNFASKYVAFDKLLNFVNLRLVGYVYVENQSTFLL